MRWAHSLAMCIEQYPGQQARLLCGHAMVSIDTVVTQDRLGFVPKRLLNDRRMLTRVALVLMHDLAAIDSVLQHEIEGTAGERLAAVLIAICCRADLADDVMVVEFGFEQTDGFELSVAPEDMSDRLGLRLVDDKLAVFRVVTERRHAAHPKTPLLRGRDLVPDPLA